MHKYTNKYRKKQAAKKLKTILQKAH